MNHTLTKLTSFDGVKGPVLTIVMDGVGIAPDTAGNAVSLAYTPTCMHTRNRALVDGSDRCVAFLQRNCGGTLYTCSYALKQRVELVNLADELL